MTSSGELREQVAQAIYEGATIHDIEIVCQSCNLTGANRGLA